MLGLDRTAEAGEVGVSHVVDEDDDDVWAFGGVQRADEKERAEEELHEREFTKGGAVRRVRSVCLSRSGEGSNFLHGRIFESRGRKRPSLETSSLVPIDFGSAVVWFEKYSRPRGEGCCRSG